jgi:hypothetical protein
MSGGSHRRQLLQNLTAVTIFLNHPRHAARLTFNASDTPQ